MVQVSAYPTIEWIRNQKVDRGPVRRVLSSHSGVLRQKATSVMDLLQQELGPILQRDVYLERSVWIATPDGELEAALILEKDGEKIALRTSGRYGRPEAGQDALVLVYGGFTALHRMTISGSRTPAGLDQIVSDLTYALMCEYPGWFSNYGKLAAGRKASDEMIVEASSNRSRRLQTPLLSLERMRLCVASDWVAPFENTLRGRSDFLAKGA